MGGMLGGLTAYRYKAVEFLPLWRGASLIRDLIHTPPYAWSGLTAVVFLKSNEVIFLVFIDKQNKLSVS